MNLHHFLTMILFLSLLCIITMPSRCQQSVRAEVGPSPALRDARAEYLLAATRYVRFLERREAMKSKLWEEKIASSDELAFYQFSVALARYELAQLQNDPAEALKQLRVAVTVREGQLDRAQHLREQGGGSDAEIDVAKRQLASARFRLARLKGNTPEAVAQLAQIQEIARREIERGRGLLGRNVGTLSELEDMQYHLIEASYLQARLKGQKDDRIRLVRDLYALTQAGLARIRKLRMQGACSQDEIEWVLFRDLVVRQRLAGAEGNTQRAREIQNQLAGLTAQMLQRALWSDHRTEEKMEYLKLEAALARYRLVQAQHGMLPEHELLWELDGWTRILD
jgi:hypothetical protein